MATHTSMYICLLMLGSIFSASLAKAEITHSAAPISIEGVPNLYLVTTNFYRSAQPTAEGFRKIVKQRGIRTVIDLRFYDRLDPPLTKDLGVKVDEVPMNPIVTVFYIETDAVLKALRVLRLSTKKAPTLLHCEDGSDRTGLITALYRIIYENWSPAQAIAEMEEPRFGFHYRYWFTIVGYIQSSRNIDLLKQQLGVTSSSRSQYVLSN